MNLLPATELLDLRLESRVNLVLLESGMDCGALCRDIKHYNSYPYKISYKYNSRGFRDEEWPINLSDAIWCIGDSFTVGLGSPLENTWVNILQSKSNTRCINVSMDGASNQWIARRAAQVARCIQPQTMVIHWSYLSRSEDPDTSKSDEDRRIPFTKQTLLNDGLMIDHFVDAISTVSAAVTKNTNLILSVVPAAGGALKGQFNYQWRKILADTNSIPEFPVLDFARDGHHYDVITATKFVDQILTKM